MTSEAGIVAWWNGIGMKLLAHMLERFVQTGTLRVIDANQVVHEFIGTAEPVATMRIHDPSLPLKIFRNPELHAGEAYMNETLTFEDCDVADFLALFSLNRATIASYPLQHVLRRISRVFRAFQQYNPIGRAQQNVAHHYDLSRELYELFLDQDLSLARHFLSIVSTAEIFFPVNKHHHIRVLLDGSRLA